MDLSSKGKRLDIGIFVILSVNVSLPPVSITSISGISFHHSLLFTINSIFQIHVHFIWCININHASNAEIPQEIPEKSLS